jgi:uncharacterized protein (DUF1499 family)|tara:strand:+ start:10424 stop:10849 length:426 start_codon:yes stop_codon:yes gene_type:complete
MGCILILSCSGKRPLNLGVSDGALALCPDTPNCVSSDAKDAKHQVQNYTLALKSDDAWQAVRKLVLKLARTKIVNESDSYLHAECRSAIFGFVDDFELYLHPGDEFISIRSAARLGFSDLGVNRKRVEQLRLILFDHGVLK